MSLERLERMWPGYRLTGKDLGGFLEEGYETIQEAWHQVYEAFPHEVSVYEMYKSVVESSGVDRWAVNVRRKAYEWSCSRDLEKREKGRYLLVHMCVGPIISGVERALKQFRKKSLSPDDLMQESLKLTLEKIDEKGIEFVTNESFGARIGNIAYLEGVKRVAETDGIPFDWTRRGLDRKIIKFISHHLEVSGDFPTPREIEERFHINRGDAERLVSRCSSQSEPTISEETSEDPLINLDEFVDAKLALSGLPPRDRAVFELGAGLWGAPLSQREIAEQLEISKARVGQRWRKAVGTLEGLNIPDKPE